MTQTPASPKIYHIVHVDRLRSLVEEEAIWCDAEIVRRPRPGTMIGYGHAKGRRLKKALTSHPGLYVGDCAPFYFCPRSVMLYVIYMANNRDLMYRGGQGPIVHLEADLRRSVQWAEDTGRRWAITGSNAASSYFDDWCGLEAIERLDWAAIGARDWRSCREGKQAEFLIEGHLSWSLVERVGVHSEAIRRQAVEAMSGGEHQPLATVQQTWYYP